MRRQGFGRQDPGTGALSIHVSDRVLYLRQSAERPVVVPAGELVDTMFHALADSEKIVGGCSVRVNLCGRLGAFGHETAQGWLVYSLHDGHADTRGSAILHASDDYLVAASHGG